MEGKKRVVIGIALILSGVLLGAFLDLEIPRILNLRGEITQTASVNPNGVVHCQITIWKGTKMLWSQYHAGHTTKLGNNMTLFKLFGNVSYRYDSITYKQNATYISIGNMGTLTTSSTVLPGEWNRTVGATKTIPGTNQINITATFHPDSSGPYTADCIGGNFGATANGNDLAFYDTFTEVTGIDQTFTINVEFSFTETG